MIALQHDQIIPLTKIWEDLSLSQSQLLGYNVAGRAGRKTNSSSLIADGWRHRTDAVASGFIVMGALLSSRLWWIDRVLGLLISLLILHAAYDVIWKNASHLLGERTNPALEQKIRDAISEVSSMVSDVYHLHVHKYGDHLEMTCNICVSPEMQIIDAHHIAKMIEEKLKRDFDIEATVHIEPERV
jgi:cation diffusion facilitator family transporter